MNPHSQAIADLNKAGYTFKRHGANHDIYYNNKLGRLIPLKRHDFDESDLRYIRQEIHRNYGERG